MKRQLECSLMQERNKVKRYGKKSKPFRDTFNFDKRGIG